MAGYKCMSPWGCLQMAIQCGGVYTTTPRAFTARAARKDRKRHATTGRVAHKRGGCTAHALESRTHESWERLLLKLQALPQGRRRCKEFKDNNTRAHCTLLKS